MSGVLGVLFLLLAATAALKTVLDEKQDQKDAAEPVEFMNIPAALEDISKDDIDELYFNVQIETVRKLNRLESI